MRINDIGATSPSIAKFDKLTRTAKQVRESKAITDSVVNEGSPANNMLVRLDNMQDAMRRMVLKIPEMDDGDLTDQVTTMIKLLDKFDEVMQRSFAIIPEGIAEARDGHDIELLKAVANQMAEDARMGDYTAIDHLLKNISVSELQGFLSDEPSGFPNHSLNTDESINEKGKGLWANIHAKRKRGEKPAKPGEKGYPKTLDIESVQEATPTSEYDYDIKKFFAKVQELEDENQHGEVAQMLTQLYGTNSELMIIRGINGIHANQGSIDPEEQKLRDKISTKYYYRAQKEAGGEKFPANTSATQGKRMGAESLGEARTNMFGIQVRDIDDKIKSTEEQIELAKINKGGWKEKDIPKLESKLAHLKMKKAKGITEEAEKNAYICVHAKKGKHECHATSSYGAAKKAAEHWGLKSTTGIDAHLAVEESVPGMAPDDYHCKDCNDTMHNPTTDCPHDSHDEQGRHWVDNNGNGIHDADEGMEQKCCCKYCGDELYGEPKTDCPYDINDPDGDNWIMVDVDGDGDPDMKIAMGSMPEGWMDDAKDAVGSTLGKVTDKVAGDFKKRKKLFGKSKK